MSRNILAKVVVFALFNVCASFILTNLHDSEFSVSSISS